MLLHAMHKAGVTSLATKAGKAVVFERHAMIKPADKHTICIVALKEEDRS